MPTNKELLEAAAFHRRRLVAGLFTGSTQDEPPGALRRALVGAAAALAAVGAVLVAGYLGVR